MENDKTCGVERHPWEPFMPSGAKILIMGTFPPGMHRWSMDFYYPNPTNDFWRIMGLLYYGDRDALWLASERRFDLTRIRNLMTEKHIALNDTAKVVRRLKGNASDKFLEIIEPVDLDSLLERMPQCHAVATTGEKAARVVADLTATTIPRMGDSVQGPGDIRIWRMPSTSRAYPLALARKAEYYGAMLRAEGCL